MRRTILEIVRNACPTTPNVNRYMTARELPGEFTGTESNDVLLWKCPPPVDLSNPNVRVYDGLFDLKTADVEEIEQCLQS